MTGMLSNFSAAAINKHYSPDQQLLCYCSAPPESPWLQFFDLRACAEKIKDWHAFFMFACLNGVGQLLHRALHGFDFFPGRELARWQNFYYFTAAENIKLLMVAKRFSCLLNENSIQHLHLKGPLLAETAYRNLALRKVGVDVDVLVQRQAVASVEALLLKNGYARVEPYDRPLQYYFNFHYHFTYQHRTAPKIELHWSLTPAYMTGARQQMNRARIVHVMDSDYTVLSDEDTLLYICQHAAQHYWRGLSLLCDAARFIHHHPALDWSLAIQIAQEERSLKKMCVALALTQRLFSMALPLVIEKELKKHQPFATYLNKRIFSPPGDLNSRWAHLFFKYWFFLKMCDQTTDQFYLLNNKISKQLTY